MDDAAAHKIVHKESPRNPRVEDRDRNGVRRGDEGLVDVFVGVTQAPVTGNLRNLKDCNLRLRVLAASAHELERELLGGG